MNTRILPVLGLALIGLAACGDGPAQMQSSEVPVAPPQASTPEPAPEVATVIATEDLARIGASIYLSPERKDAILAEADMTEEAFTALVEQLALDAEASYRYAKAFEAELASR